MKVFLKQFPKIIDYFIIFLLSLTPLLWYRRDLMINGSDTQYPLFPLQHLYKHFFTWDPALNTGVEGSRFLGVFTYTLERFLFSLFGLPFNIQQVLSFVPFFFFAGFFFYLLMKQIYQGHHQRLVALLGVVFYLFNQYNMSGVVWVHGGGAPAAAFVMVPAVLLVIIRTLKGHYPLFKGAFYASLASLLGTAAGINPPFTFVAWLPIVAYLTFELVINAIAKDGNNFKRALSLSLLLVLVAIAVNAYWFLPAAYGLAYVLTVYNSGNIESLTYANYLIGFSKDTSIINTIRMQGGIDWYEAHKGEPFVGYAKHYFTNPILIIASFLLPIFSYLTLIFVKNRYTVFFTLLAVFATINAVGPHEPFKDSYTWLQENIFIYKLLRSPWYKFVFDLVISYAVLVPIALVSSSNWLANRLKKLNQNLANGAFGLAILLGTTLNLIYTYPLFTGELFAPELRITASVYTHFPDYIFDFKDYIESKPESFRIVSVPFGDQEVFRFTPETGYQGPNPLLYIVTDKPVLHRINGAASREEDLIREQFQKEILDHSDQDPIKLMGMMNAKYVLLKNDIDDDYYATSISLSRYSNQLNAQTGVGWERSFGKWDLYRIEDDFYSEKMSTPSKVIIEDKYQNFSKLLKTANLNQTVIVKTPAQSLVENQNLSSPQITFQQLNPTSYRVVVKNSTGPFILNFAESFSPLWKAYIKEGLAQAKDAPVSQKENVTELKSKIELFTTSNIFKKPLNEATHFKTNGFGNGWLINNQGDITVDIEYENQHYVYLGLIISGLSILISVLYLVWVKVNSKKK